MCRTFDERERCENFFFSPANEPHLATLLFNSADLRIDMPEVHDISGISLGAMPPSLTPRQDAQLVDAERERARERVREREKLADMLGWVFGAILARVAILLKPSVSYCLTSSGTSRQPGTSASDFPASLLKGLAYNSVIAFVQPRAVSHAAPGSRVTRN